MHLATPMIPCIDVSFPDHVRDRSLEGAVHRWVARLEAMRFDVHATSAMIERAGRSQTTVTLSITLGNDAFATAVISHADPFFAVSEAFRTVRREFLARAADGRRSDSAAC